MRERLAIRPLSREQAEPAKEIERVKTRACICVLEVDNAPAISVHRRSHRGAFEFAPVH